jgi:2-keto-4-pentenoate hydratase/2-oxohepta-3-ene-1,7-dioic acid hydratase in catechol pathway
VEKSAVMIWCRYRASGGSSWGIVEGDRVHHVEGNPFAEFARTGASYPLSAVELDVPVVPGTFFCAGLNYAEHIVKMAERRGAKPSFPASPRITYRAPGSLIAHGRNIVKPRDATDALQYEGELVAVIGKPARRVAKADALDYVFGWTIGNDVSERSWQASEASSWRAKNSDTFHPMGPWIVTDADLDAMMTTVRVNGETTDHFRTNNMLFDVPTYISEISQYATLYPGDIIWMGTDGLPRDIKPGDTVEIEISGIGTLRNGVVAEKGSA